jgi:ATP/maltotriose-dependent transcriptional regulator MalT
MTEPPTTTLPGAAGPARDALLATKLHVPRPRTGFVPRPRLLARLGEGMACELVLICTPAGFGKTSLLGDWVRGGRRPVAWLSLDEGDNDPARFWRHVVAALDRVHPGGAERAGALLADLQSASLEAVVTTLVNELAGVTDEIVLVLDDYHLVQAAPVHASLGLLLEHLPGSLRLVVASRADPPLPLARLRARGQLAELRAADLRFTPEEVAQLLQAAVGPDLPEAVVAALEKRTEGWAAGLQLAALSLRGHADPAGFVDQFSGSHRYVLDYLVEEVLDRQPEALRQFLLATSVLERLSGPLCDAVCGGGDSQQLLEQVERANLFLVPLDEVRGWWRYHQLFADLLRARLTREQPERVAGLHHAAAAWSEEHGLADDAVRHALAAGDAAWAVRLVERHADAVLLRSERVTLTRWLAALPAELTGARPRLLLAQTLFALASGQVDEVEGLLDAAERAAADAGDEPYEPAAGHAASLLANIPAAIALARAFQAELRGDADREIAFGRRALAEAEESEAALVANTRAHLGVAKRLAGQLPEAEQALAASVAELLAAGQRSVAVRACEHLAQVQRAQGRLDAALGSYQHGLEIAAPPGRAALPAAGIAYVGMAELAYQQGDLDAALRHLTQGIGPCRQLFYTHVLATGLATLGWVRQAQGDPAGAMDAMEEACRVAPSPGVASLLNPVPALRARLLLAQGGLAAAAGWTKARGLSPDDEVSYQREPEYLVLARVLVAQDRPDQALGLLERLHALAASQGRTGSLIEIQALQALALQASGDEPAALAALVEVLMLAAPQGYLRVFVDEGTPMATLLGSLVATPAIAQVVATAHLPPAYLGRLLQAFEQASQAALPGPWRAAAVAGPLSARELEVLGLLSAGKSNPAVAAELVISLDTVKRHVTHILDKLGVANRVQAVTRARALGLLD